MDSVQYKHGIIQQNKFINCRCYLVPNEIKGSLHIVWYAENSVMVNFNLQLPGRTEENEDNS